MFLVELEPFAISWRARLSHGFQIGYRALVNYDDVMSYYKRGFRANRWHRKSALCMGGGDERHIHLFVGQFVQRR